MIKFLPLDFLSVWHRVPWKNENAVYRLQISALVPEVFKFEKNIQIKYANKICKICKLNDWWRHTLNLTLFQVYKESYIDQFAV